MSDSTSFDPKEFRFALGSFTTGVTVVTSHGDNGDDVGLTANSFNSVSLDPPMVLWSLAKSAGSLPVFKEAEHFAVHILAEDVSNQFARPGDKFANVAIERGPGNIPLLTHYTARFICKTAYQYEGGDHIIFVGEVLDFSHQEQPPLLFHAGQYGQIKKGQAEPEEAPDNSLGFLLSSSYHRLIAPIRETVHKRELSMRQYYLLADIAIHKRKSLQSALDALAFSGHTPSQEEIANLFERGYIETVDKGIQLTEQGVQFRIELASLYKAAESEALNSMGYSSAQSLKILLDQFISCTGKNR